MRTIHFDIQGFNRSYWDFFVGAGLQVGAFLLFAAILAWQLGSLGQPALKLLSMLTWSFATLFVGVTLLSWMYLFLIPLIFSALISLCLISAAWLSGQHEQQTV